MKHLLILFLLASSGAAFGQPRPDTPMVETQLFFGLHDSNDHPISIKAWNRFVDTCITRNFPDGYTILEGQGYWSERGRTYKEPARTVVVVRPKTSEMDLAVSRVKASYCAGY